MVSRLADVVVVSVVADDALSFAEDEKVVMMTGRKTKDGTQNTDEMNRRG